MKHVITLLVLYVLMYGLMIYVKTHGLPVSTAITQAIDGRLASLNEYANGKLIDQR